MLKIRPISLLTVLVCLVLLLCGCSNEQVSSDGGAVIAENATPAEGYELKTEQDGSTKVIAPSGEVIADTSRGDTVTLTADGTLIISDADGNSTIIDSNGAVHTEQSDAATNEITEDVAVKSGEDKSGAATKITLKGGTAEIVGKGASLKGKDLVITSSGSYSITGTLDNGRLVISATNARVNLFLNGVRISSDYSSALYVHKAAAVTVTLCDKSVNLLKDAATYSYDDGYSSADKGTPDAALYSESELALCGGGELYVISSSANAINCKQALTAEAVTLSLNSRGHGITGKESVELSSVKLKLDCDGDGIRSTSTDNFSVGAVTLDNCDATITAGEDGIQAESTLTLKSGSYKLLCGDGSEGTPSSVSQKGLKGVNRLVIEGGSFNISSTDDALHSNGSISISGGNFIIKTADDAVHADDDLEITGGTLIANVCFEGLEATNISLSGGNIKIVSLDDGINVSGGDGSGSMGRPGGMDSFGSSGGALTISGGTINVNAEGDGLDANGSIKITGGIVTVDGPVSGGNGALDCDQALEIDGGIFVAVGSRDMAQAPSSSGAQNCIVLALDGSRGAGELLHLQDSAAKEIITYRPQKSYAWVAISTPTIKTGESYTAYSGGSHSGRLNGNIFSGGAYTPGEKLDSVTVSDTVSGDISGGMGGHGGMGGMGGHGKHPFY